MEISPFYCVLLKLIYLLFRIVSFILFQCLMVETNGGHNVEISAGAYWKSLPDVVIYEATIPINYETEWAEEKLQEEAKKPKNKCEGNNQNRECLVSQQIDSLSKAFLKEFILLNENWDAQLMRQENKNTRGKRALDFVGSALSWCCGVATMEKLRLVEESEDNVKDKLMRMTQGLSGVLKEISQNSKAFKDYDESIASTFRETELRMKVIERHSEELEDRLANATNEEGRMTSTILYYQYMNLRKMVMITRSLRRQAIMQSCKQHRIPADIIHPQILREDLTKLELELETSGQGLAIHVPEISKYYQIQICDCSYTENKLFIHVKVPIIKMKQSWKLYELITTPFAWFNQTCTITHQPLYMAVSSTVENRDEMRQISGAGLHQCKPYHSQLCYIPRFSADNIQGPECARKLYEGTTVQQLAQYCPMSCHSATSMIISEISEEVYMLTHPKKGLEVTCRENKSYKLNPEHPHQGSIKVKLPCNCQLQSETDIVIPKRFPCPDFLVSYDAQITHIIPATWSTLKSFVLNPKSNYLSPTYKNMSECLNNNWTLHIPHVNLTSSETTEKNIISLIRQTIPMNSNSYTYGFHSDTLFLCWNIVLSFLVVYLLFKNTSVTLTTPLFTRTNGQEITANTTHDAVMGLIYTCFTIFILFLILRLVYFYYKRTSKKPRNDRQTIEKKNEETYAQDRELNEMTSKGNFQITLKSERNNTLRYSLEIIDDKDIRSLSPGDKVKAEIELVKIDD